MRSTIVQERAHRRAPAAGGHALRVALALGMALAGLALPGLADCALAASGARLGHRAIAGGPARHSGGGSAYPAAVSRPFSRPHRSPLARLAAARRKAKKPRKPVLHGNPARALRAFEAMQRFYYVRGSGLYAGEPFSYLWPFSQAFAATVSMYNVPGLPVSFAPELHARLIGVRNYLDANNSGAPEGTYTSTLAAFDGTAAPPTGPGGAKYYDDNDWVGIEMARVYKRTRNPGALGYAEGIMAFEMAGFSTDQSLACPGGIPFSNLTENTDRNTITTAPAAELAVQLYRITGNVQYLQFAETAYNWVRTCLLQSNGLYADHIRPHGVVDQTFWSYNQGVMIGAGTLLYQSTGNAAYLYQARQTAQLARAYFTPQRLGAENPFFPSIYFRNVLYLDSVTHDPPGPKLAQAYVDYAWQNLRLSDDLFVAGSPASAQLLYQSAIVQIYALLASSPGTYF
ncbi:MAG TPA: glycoside hydrolase family 76 protein [Solirubrobacteraceae bacterium]|nr:glycoside hydrolase family 76 protein [Solirubrobacteraceae bacterium]